MLTLPVRAVELGCCCTLRPRVVVDVEADFVDDEALPERTLPLLPLDAWPLDDVRLAPLSETEPLVVVVRPRTAVLVDPAPPECPTTLEELPPLPLLPPLFRASPLLPRVTFRSSRDDGLLVVEVRLGP